MKLTDLDRMSVDDLWALHIDVSETLAAKMAAEKDLLEKRISRLQRHTSVDRRSREPERRSYPTVLPKFRNPDEPMQTWTGRGKQPRWLTAQLRSGRRIDDFKIQHAAE